MGAIEFLTKTLCEQELLDAVNAAIDRDRARRKQAEVVAKLRERFDALTPGERQVLLLAMTGSQNKQIACQLKLSENTVEVHRWQGMRKMQARSWVELTADKLTVSSGGS